MKSVFPKGTVGGRIQMFVVASLLAGLCACAAPIGVVRMNPERAQQNLTRSFLTAGELSERAQILLRKLNQEKRWKEDPAAVLAFVQTRVASPVSVFSAELRARSLDAAAELAFAHASETGDRRYYLTAALYAWLYLFPEHDMRPPDSLERGVRLSADIYNRSVNLAFENRDTGNVVLEDSEYELPFGTLTVDFDESSLLWGNRELTNFASLADLRVQGINNRYRTSGIGAPLAARIAELPDKTNDDLVFSKVRVPVSAVLRFEDPESNLTSGLLRAHLSVVAYSASDTVTIDGRQVPIEVEPTAALALLLTEAPPWKRELRGFFQGDLAEGKMGLTSLAPYQRGRIPIVLVHGTASSAGRWADLLNDLESDPVLRQNYQFWLFSYNTGSPIAYSGWLLRKSIADLVESLDPKGTDPVLRDLVVMGHSQGGLLTKLLAVDSGQTFWNRVIGKPRDQIELEPENRKLIEGSLLVKPSPYVKRVIFLSTPHRGSVLATWAPARWIGRLVRAPANVVAAVGDAFSDDPEAEVQRQLRTGGGAVGNMSPRSPFIKDLAEMPIAPGIHAHSIMGVRKGPKETGGDGVVSYGSAHLDDVESEFVVQSGHSSQSNPLVVGEVRRILLVHLSEAIDEKIVRLEEHAQVD